MKREGGGRRGDRGPGIEAAAGVLRERLGEVPDLLLVLGSGLGGVAEAVEEPVHVDFGDLPGFPPVGVRGHGGRYVAGTLEGRPVLVQSGRYHLYEGHPVETVCAPVRVAAAAGVRTLVLTNAAGSLHRRLAPGSILLLDDHIDWMGRSALAGALRPGEERFPDMSAPYDPELQGVAVEAAAELGIALERGVYAGLLGPTYETPAEIRMLRRLGADAVGMSTVPEVIVARALALRVLAFSMISNLASGLSGRPLTHEEVVEVGQEAGKSLERLIREVVRRM